MAELEVKLVAADRQVWEGTATMVVAKTLDGEIGIMPGHEPVLAVMPDSVVRIEAVGGGRVVAAVHGGFFSVDSNVVSILAETAELAAEIDVARAQAALARAADEAEGDAASARERADVRIRAAALLEGHR